MYEKLSCESRNSVSVGIHGQGKTLPVHLALCDAYSEEETPNIFNM